MTAVVPADLIHDIQQEPRTVKVTRFKKERFRSLLSPCSERETLHISADISPVLVIHTPVRRHLTL